MEPSTPVKVTIAKRRRPSSQRSVKSESSSIKVTRVKSLTSKSVKKIDATMVVENIDTVSTEYRKLSSLRFNKTVPISPIEYLKKATDQPSNSPHSSKSNTIISVQKRDLFHSNSRNQLLNCSSLKLDTDGRREIYTIGKNKMNKKEKAQLWEKCSVRYYIGIGLTLCLIFGIIVALPVTVVSILITTKTTTMSTTSTTVTVSTITSTITTTITTTSVTTATAAATATITSNACTSSWTGITMIYHCDSCSLQSTYASMSFNYVAIANITRISFVLRRDFGYFGIDDISIRDTTASGVELLSNGGFENGSFSSWIHCVQAGSLAIGSVQSTASGISYNGYPFVANSGNYYYLGGATVNAEYLSQTFSSIIGHTYTFSFVYVYYGSGSLSSGDFLLSI